MKTDRELLELAAKAAGYSLSWTGPDRDVPETKERGTWSPLGFKEHAFELLCQLSMQVVESHGGAKREIVFVIDDEYHAEEIEWPHTPKAHCYAIVLAAAAIQEAKENKCQA